MENQGQNAEKHYGETKAVENNVHDLIHDLGSRIDAVWRYDQYIANAKEGGNSEEGKLWAELKDSEINTVNKLKTLLHNALGKDKHVASQGK